MVLLTMVLTKYALLNSFVENSYLSHFEFLILIISVLFITAGGYIINDIYDVEADKINKPNKIFIDKTISKKNAWKSYFLLTFLGLILGVFISFYKALGAFSVIFIFTILALYFYSKNLKKLPLLGNLITSLCIAFVIYIVYLFGFKYIEFFKLTHEEIENATLFLQIWVATILYAAFAFLTTLIREIIKDIEDVNGDLKINAKTLPIILGRKRASKVAFFFSGILYVFLLITLQFFKNKYLFL
jgi:4-hydroxybenzoate polyprenyltransferase